MLIDDVQPYYRMELYAPARGAGPQPPRRPAVGASRRLGGGGYSPEGRRGFLLGRRGLAGRESDSGWLGRARPLAPLLPLVGGSSGGLLVWALKTPGLPGGRQ